MTAYDPTSGELRTHYAGFFDPGFGFDPSGGFDGSRAALEVRAHDVPFMIEHGQRVCKLTFEHMLEAPDRLYGAGHRLELPGAGRDAEQALPPQLARLVPPGQHQAGHRRHRPARPLLILTLVLVAR